MVDLFFGVSEKNIDAKIVGMEHYEFEKRQYPHLRSPEVFKVLAKRWGIAIEKKYAEAFQLILSIQ